MSESIKQKIESLYHDTVAKIGGLKMDMTVHKQNDKFDEALKCQIKHDELVLVRDRLENVMSGEW